MGLALQTKNNSRFLEKFLPKSGNFLVISCIMIASFSDFLQKELEVQKIGKHYFHAVNNEVSMFDRAWNSLRVAKRLWSHSTEG